MGQLVGYLRGLHQAQSHDHIVYLDGHHKQCGIRAYRGAWIVFNPSTADEAPKNWTFEGSTNNSTWVVCIQLLIKQDGVIVRNVHLPSQILLRILILD